MILTHGANSIDAGGSFEPVPDNIELHEYFEKVSGSYFDMPEITTSLYDKTINNKFTIKGGFSLKIAEGNTTTIIGFPAQNSVNGNIELKLRNYTSNGYFMLQSRKIGNNTSQSTYPYIEQHINTSDADYFNRFVEFSIFEDKLVLDGVTYNYNNVSQSNLSEVVKLGGWRLQQSNFGNDSKFYPIEIYEPDGTLFDRIYPAYNETTGDKGIYSFRLVQFFYDYTGTSINNIALGPVVSNFLTENKL